LLSGGRLRPLMLVVLWEGWELFFESGTLTAKDAGAFFDGFGGGDDGVAILTVGEVEV
jgi:hypothetical protein